VSRAAAITNGFVVAFEVGAALCIAGAVVAALLLRGLGADPVARVVAHDREVAPEESERLAA
jgi:hypothetical protein